MEKIIRRKSRQIMVGKVAVGGDIKCGFQMGFVLVDFPYFPDITIDLFFLNQRYGTATEAGTGIRDPKTPSSC